MSSELQVWKLVSRLGGIRYSQKKTAEKSKASFLFSTAFFWLQL